MLQDRLHVVMVESQSGFPYAGAAASRLRLLSRALTEAGAEVTVILLKPSQDPHAGEKPSFEGNYRGVHYRYAAGTAIRSNWFVIRRWHALVAAFRLVSYLYHYRRMRASERVVVYLSTDAPGWTVITCLLAKVLGFPLVMELCEWKPAVPGCSRLQELCNSFRLSWADGVFAISHDLRCRAAKRCAPRSILRVPILVDCEEWSPRWPGGAPYVLWCGQISAYRQSVLWLVKAFASVARAYPDARFVIAGMCDDSSRKAIQKTAAEAGLDTGRVDVRGYVSQADLAELYGSARALLAPLENDERSRARFPTKIGEYLASGRPVITTAVGEVRRYFTDGVNALVAPPDDMAGFATRIADALEVQELADCIGTEGRRVARLRFQYSNHGLRMALFLESLCHRRA